MKYVHRVTGKDDEERLYFRKAGMPSVRLRHPWGSPELAAEVAAILSTSKPTAPSTLRAALRDYELRSADFKALAASTQYEYRLILKELEDDFGELPVSRFRAAFLLDLRDAWAPRGHRAANVRLQVLKNVLWPAIVDRKLGDGDPFTLIPQVRRPRDAAEPHLMWSDDAVHKVIAAALAAGKPGLARGVAIGRYAGARRDDIVRITKAARKGGRFAFVSGKRRVAVDMAEDPRLARILDNTPAHGLILAYNLSGVAYTADGFALELRKIVRALHARSKSKDPQEAAQGLDSDRYDVHGLRHTFGVEIALAGCTDAQGAVMLGHASPASFAAYRRQADRIRLADDATTKIAALRERSPNADLENALENAWKTAPSKAAKPRGKNAGKTAR